MKINWNNKSIYLNQADGEIAIDEFCTIIGMADRPILKDIILDDGETPIDKLQKDVVVGEAFTKAITMEEYMNTINNRFMLSVNSATLHKISTMLCGTDDKVHLFSLIKIEPNAILAMAKCALCNDYATDSDLSASFSFTHQVNEISILANMLLYSNMVDLVVVGVTSSGSLLLFAKNKNEVIATINMDDYTVNGKMAEKLKKAIGWDDKSLSKGSANTAAKKDYIAVPNVPKPFIDSNAARIASVKLKHENPLCHIADAPKTDQAKKSKAKIIINKIEAMDKPTVVDNPEQNVTLADTMQVVERHDLKTLYHYVHQNSLCHIADEDKAHVMSRVELAIKALIKDPANVALFFKGAPEVKYGFIKTYCKDKDNFMLTNGDKYWKFIYEATDGPMYGFTDTMKQAEGWPLSSIAESKEKFLAKFDAKNKKVDKQYSAEEEVAIPKSLVE